MNMISSFPRILVASDVGPFGAGGSAAIMKQILRGHPKERLFLWSASRVGVLPPDFPQDQHVSGILPPLLVPHLRYTRVKAVFIEHGWSQFAAWHLWKTVAKVRPDVVWLVANLRVIFPFVLASRRLTVPFHVSIHDYPGIHNQKNIYGTTRCERMMEGLRNLLGCATTRDATSREMADDFPQRFGVSADAVIHFGLEDSELQALKEPILPPADRVVRIAHAGTINCVRDFELFVSALRIVRTQVGRPLELHFFGAHSYAGMPWFDPVWMYEHGNLPSHDLHQRLRRYTWGFAPMRLDNGDPDYNRYSFPTRFITYLSAGLPSITLAHPESSVFKMAVRYGTGLALSTTQVPELAAALLEPLRDESPSVRYREGILRCAKVEFHAPTKRRMLLDCFQRCIEKKRHTGERFG
jgi:hypothetical protein